MGCLESMNYEILARNCSFREAREIIRRVCRECYEIQPGFRLLDKPVIGVPPVYAGISDEGKLVYGYTKPCYGTFVVAVDDEDGVMSVRKSGRLLNK